MSISSDGLISWVVGSEHDGNSYNVRALAIDEDALLAVGRSFTVTVNHNPKWEVIGAQSVKEQNLLAFAPVAIDLDDTDLSLVASGLPAGATYDSSSGFAWTPGNGQIGVHNVGFTVTDPHGSSSDLSRTDNRECKCCPNAGSDLLRFHFSGRECWSADGCQ